MLFYVKTDLESKVSNGAIYGTPEGFRESPELVLQDSAVIAVDGVCIMTIPTRITSTSFRETRRKLLKYAQRRKNVMAWRDVGCHCAIGLSYAATTSISGRRIERQR